MSHPLQQRVSTVRGRWNRRATVELVCWLLVAALGMLLVVGLTDFAVRPVDRGLRVLLTIALVGGVALAGKKLITWWRDRRWSDLSAAQKLQQTYPQLGDRLASALEFLGQEEDDPTAGSAKLRRAVVADATAALDTVPAEQVATSRNHGRTLTFALVTAVVFAALWLFAPQSMSTSLARLLAPWNNLEWPREHNLEFTDPPTMLARGEAFEASLVDTSATLPDEVSFEVRTTDGTERTWMQRVGNTMVARRENVRQNFEFRATGGDHHTMEWTKVEVVDPPGLKQLPIDISPPSYAGIKRSRLTVGERVLSGSSLGVFGVATESLSKAVLKGTHDEPIALTVGEFKTLTELSLDREWIVETDESSKFIRGVVELVSAKGIPGFVELPTIEVVPDTPPTVAWQGNTAELFVIDGATIPLSLDVADNLAVAAAHLETTASAMNLEGNRTSKIDLYSASDPPAGIDSLPPPGEFLDTRTLSTELKLKELKLPVGSVIEIVGVASDFKPQTTTTNRPRRITIITEAELESRLAAKQNEILRLLEQALADQRASRDGATLLAPQVDASRKSIDAVVAARLAQQAVSQSLQDPVTGVVTRINELMAELTINGQSRPQLVEQLQTIVKAVDTLDAGPMPAAEQALTSIRKTLESQLEQELDADQREALASTFASLDGEQAIVIQTLEELIERVNAWSDAERFIRELVRLELEQRAAREASLDAAKINLLAATNRNVEPVDRDEFARMATDQGELTRRFDKLLAAMRDMSASDTIADDFAARLASALSVADEQSVSANMASAAQQLDDQQPGIAADAQLTSADGLREMIDRLRDRTPTDPKELANRLRELAKELAKTKQDASDAKDPDDERKLSDKLKSLSQEMKRLTADEASKKADEASDTAAPRQGETPEQREQRREQTRREIEESERELARRIAQLEGEQQQKLLDRLAEVLDDLIPRQQKALEQTVGLELVRENQPELGEADLQRLQKLSQEEEKLATELDEAIADVEKRAVFKLALGGAAGDMRQAATALSNQQTGRTTQNLQLAALARMRHVLDILREQPPPPEEPNDDGGGGGGGGGDQPQKPPLIELAEVKMLRWLQLDINGRTRLFEADLADNAADSNIKREAANRLATEQKELAELVREMLERNNRDVERPIDL